MKKSFFKTLFTAYMTIISIDSAAQCNISNSSNIIAGFFPPDSTQPCVVTNQPYAATIQFQNLGIISANATVVSTRIDTVYNLPAGINWAMNVPNGNAANTLLQSQIGCLQLTGVTTSGQAIYNLDFGVTVDVSLNGFIQTYQDRTSVLINFINSTFGTNLDFEYRLFVVNNEVDCGNVTSTTEPYIVPTLSVFPNPFTDKINISNTKKNEHFSLVNHLGQTIYLGYQIQEQSFKALSDGIYFLIIATQNQVKTYRLIKR